MNLLWDSLLGELLLFEGFFVLVRSLGPLAAVLFDELLPRNASLGLLLLSGLFEFEQAFAVQRSLHGLHQGLQSQGLDCLAFVFGLYEAVDIGWLMLVFTGKKLYGAVLLRRTSMEVVSLDVGEKHLFFVDALLDSFFH